MYFRLMGKLSARRKAILDQDKEQGFTLIELLVVVVIIGVLAAIAIPIYIGVQNTAKDGAAKSDLTNAKTAVVAYFVQEGDVALPAGGLSALGAYGFTQNATYPAAFSGTAPAKSSDPFCIEEASGSGATFHISDAVAATTGDCTP